VIGKIRMECRAQAGKMNGIFPSGDLMTITMSFWFEVVDGGRGAGVGAGV